MGWTPFTTNSAAFLLPCGYITRLRARGSELSRNKDGPGGHCIVAGARVASTHTRSVGDHPLRILGTGAQRLNIYCQQVYDIVIAGMGSQAVIELAFATTS